MKVIIVGGVAGGATAAARIRRLDEHAEITVFERSGYISYANCGLPYYIGDVERIGITNCPSSSITITGLSLSLLFTEEAIALTAIPPILFTLEYPIRCNIPVA